MNDYNDKETPRRGNLFRASGMPVPQDIYLGELQTHYTLNRRPRGECFRRDEIEQALHTLMAHPQTLRIIEVVASYIRKYEPVFARQANSRALATIMVYEGALKHNAGKVLADEDGLVRAPGSPEEIVDALRERLGNEEFFQYASTLRLFQKKYAEACQAAGSARALQESAGSTRTCYDSAGLVQRLHPLTRDMVTAAFDALGSVAKHIRSAGSIQALRRAYDSIAMLADFWSSALMTGDRREMQFERLTAERDELSDGVDALLAERDNVSIGLLSEGKIGLDLLFESLPQDSSELDYGPFANGEDSE